VCERERERERKMDHKERGYGLDHVAQNSIQWQALVNMVMKLRVP